MDYNYNQVHFQEAPAQLVVATTDDYSAGTDLLAAPAARNGGALRRICVQKITVNTRTQHNSTYTIRAKTTTAQILASATNQAVGTLVADYGVEGFKLPAGEALQFIQSGPGQALTITIDGYIEPVPST